MKLVQTLLDIPPFFSAEYGKEVLQNAIACTLGSIIPIVASVIIYVSSVGKNEKARLSAKAEEDTNNLKAFAILLLKGIKVSKQQAENIKQFNESLSRPFIEYPLLAYIPSNDLKRVIDSITIEKTGLAYMNSFSSVPNVAKEFTEILSCIDYLYLAFEQLPEMMKMAILNDLERKKEMRQIFHSSYKLLETFMLKVTTGDSIYPHIQDIGQTLINFQKNHKSNYDTKFYYDSFFLPMYQNCINLIQNDIRDNFIISFTQQTNEGKQMYEHILEENKRMLEDMNKIYSSICEGIDTLLLNSKTLLSSEYAS
jgi:hypothetical protein